MRKLFQVIPSALSNMCVPPYRCEVNQNKQLACRKCKTYHGKINEAVLRFADMAYFGDVSCRVYFKQKTALNVLWIVASFSLIRSQQLPLQ